MGIEIDAISMRNFFCFLLRFCRLKKLEAPKTFLYQPSGPCLEIRVLGHSLVGEEGSTELRHPKL